MTNGKLHGVKRYVVRCPNNTHERPFEVLLRRSRERDVFDALIAAGATGCSFFDSPAPRWAASIHRLRRRGIQILTELESHGGDFPGRHARYCLTSEVTIDAEGGSNGS